MDADEDGVVFAVEEAPGVDAADSFFEWDIIGFGDQEFCVVALGFES